MYKAIYKRAKPIIVDGLEFPSITIAASTLMVSTLELHHALIKGNFRGKSIAYKNIYDIPKQSLITPVSSDETLRYKAPSEKPIVHKSNTAMEEAFAQAQIKLNEQQEPKENKMKVSNIKGKKRSIAVVIDGKVFNSMYDAGKYFNADPAMISWALGHNRERMWHGMSIAYMDEAKEASVKEALNAKPVRAKRKTVKAEVDEQPKPVVKEIMNNSAIETARKILTEEAGKRLLNGHSIAEVKQLLDVIEQL
jgi:hypothetical protein